MPVASPDSSRGSFLPVEPLLVSRATWLWVLGVAGVLWGIIFVVPVGPLQSEDFLGILKPYQEFFRSTLFHGELPLWNPYASLGRPFLADPQAVALWPGSVLYVLLGVSGGAWALVSLHAAWAVVSTAKVTQRLGATGWMAWGAGWCFVLNPKLLSHAHAGHVQYVISFLTLPAVVAAFLTLQEAVNLRAMARLALVVAWQLLEGAPQVFWCTGVLIGGLGLATWLAAPSRQSARQFWRATGGTAAAYGWGFALAAISLLPAFELIGQSNRGAKLPALSAVGPLSLRELPSLYTFFGSARQLWDYEAMIFPGAILGVLGVAGLAAWWTRAGRRFALTTAAVVFLAAAPATFWHPWLVDWFPGYGSFRFHSRWGIALGWLLAVSAAVFLSQTTRPLVRRALLLGAAVFGLGVLFALYPSLLWDSHAGNADWVILPAGFLVMALAAGLWSTRKSSAAGPDRRLVFAFGALLVAELLVVLLFYKTGYPRDQARPLESKILPVIAHAGLAAAGQPPPRAYLPVTIAHNNAGMQLGYSALFGYESLALVRTRAVSHWAIGIEPPAHTDYAAFGNMDARLPWPAAGFGLQVGYDPASRLLVTRPAPDIPRAWLTAAVTVTDDWRKTLRLAAPKISPNTAAILEQTDGRIARLGADGQAEIKIKNFAVNQVSLTVNSRQPQLLVLAEPWYPGWSVAVNGKSEKSFPVNGWMRGAFVPAGASSVVFSFHSTWLWRGGLISLVALAGVLVVEWLARKRETHVKMG